MKNKVAQNYLRKGEKIIALKNNGYAFTTNGWTGTCIRKDPERPSELFLSRSFGALRVEAFIPYSANMRVW